MVPFLKSSDEIKTKPTQHSVKELRSLGIQPNILLCRADREIPEDERKKIGLFCNVEPKNVIQALNANTIYKVPINLKNEGLDIQVLDYFKLGYKNNVDLSMWSKIAECILDPEGEVTIGIVGKYTGLADAYKSLNEALSHGGIFNNVRVSLKWIESEEINESNLFETLENCDGILVPGGFGERGSEGKILAIKYARENKIPYFGICFGMQLAVIEMARNILGIKEANSSEFADCKESIVGLMTEWSNVDNTTEKRTKESDLGGTMRLGAYEAKLKNNSNLSDNFVNIKDLEIIVIKSSQIGLLYTKDDEKVARNGSFLTDIWVRPAIPVRKMLQKLLDFLVVPEEPICQWHLDVWILLFKVGI